MKNFNPEDFKIFECVTGSRMYGLSTPESDFDIRGICIPPMDILLDPFNNFEQQDGYKEEDKTIYNLRKFVKLCADGNPNIVELLFVPQENILIKTPEWDYILKNKDLFLSKKIKYTFTGYAFAQLKAIQRHRQWFINPPKEKPQRKDFGLTDSPIVSGENLENALNISHELFKEEYHRELVCEREYRDAKKQWDNYQSWFKNRNPKRRELEDKFSYDAKHASHLVRLMTEGKELLLTGKITFPLKNADEILAIKNGKYSYDEIISMTEEMDAGFEKWYDESPLPHSANKKGISQLYLDIVNKGDKIEEVL